MDGPEEVVVAAAPLRYVAAFIDVPNICRSVRFDRHSKGKYQQIDWEKLFEFMLESLDTEDRFCIARAYSFSEGRLSPEHKRSLERRLREDFGRHDVQAFMSEQYDIDTEMATDIYDHTLRLIEEQVRHGKMAPFQATLLVASGDHIFGSVVQKLRARFGDQLDLTLHTFSWKLKLSQVLYAASDRVMYLEQDPLLIKR